MIYAVIICALKFFSTKHFISIFDLVINPSRNFFFTKIFIYCKKIENFQKKKILPSLLNNRQTLTLSIRSWTSIRYSKRPLRGPYGEMLEAEMAKPRTTDIALEEGLRPRRKISANLSYTSGTHISNSEPPTPCHHRTTSSPSKLESHPAPSHELLAELLRGSSERVARTPIHRSHVSHSNKKKKITNSSLLETIFQRPTIFHILRRKSHEENVICSR